MNVTIKTLHGDLEIKRTDSEIDLKKIAYTLYQLNPMLFPLGFTNVFYCNNHNHLFALPTPPIESIESVEKINKDNIYRFRLKLDRVQSMSRFTFGFGRKPDEETLRQPQMFDIFYHSTRHTFFVPEFGSNTECGYEEIYHISHISYRSLSKLLLDRMYMYDTYNTYNTYEYDPERTEFILDRFAVYRISTIVKTFIIENQ